jgi:hypothetical protein
LTIWAARHHGHAVAYVHSWPAVQVSTISIPPVEDTGELLTHLQQPTGNLATRAPAAPTNHPPTLASLPTAPPAPALRKVTPETALPTDGPPTPALITPGIPRGFHRPVAALALPIPRPIPSFSRSRVSALGCLTLHLIFHPIYLPLAYRG